MNWEQVPEKLDEWTLKTAAPASDLRRAASLVFTQGDVGYYWHPDRACAGIFGREATATDLELCKRACCAATGSGACLGQLSELDLATGWVKVAYSPTLNRAAKFLNFLPGQYPGGIPNHPSPLAAMLTTGLVGGGLGWAGGKLLSKVFPERYGKNLPRTGAILGGLLGAAPGAAWAGINAKHGKGLLDGWPLAEPGGPAPGTWLPKETTAEFLDEYLPGWNREHVADVATIDAVPLNAHCRRAIGFTAKQAAETFGEPEERLPPTPSDVNINALGQTLWETGASPQLTSTTLGAMYAAQQLPDPRARAGYVTGNQLGQLTSNMVGNYARGYLVGATLNRVVGTPYSANQTGQAAAALGIIASVVPKLFGP